jgi:RNA polymerase sigma-70 factor (ECF subfamily)
MATNRPPNARADADSSFEQLYRGHRADVFRAALRELGNVHDAEDVTQAAFVDAYRAVLRGTSPESPRAWLLAIAENVRRRRFRSAQRRPSEVPLHDDAAPAAEGSHEQAAALAAALAQLPEQQREAFVLREISGLAYDEIARRTDSTVASVQMLLFRARRTLRAELDPPVAAPRRPGAIVPLPGWVAGLGSRIDALALTPRAAGVAGAAALAMGGVGSGTASEQRVPPAPAVRAPAPLVSAPAPAPARRAPLPAPVPAAPQPEPAVASPALPPAPTAPGATPSQTAAPVAPSEPARPPAAESTAPPVLTVVPAAPAVPEPSIPALSPFASQLEEAVEDAGAAGAAGAVAPPLPLPALDQLPPVP